MSVADQRADIPFWAWERIGSAEEIASSVLLHTIDVCGVPMHLTAIEVIGDESDAGTWEPVDYDWVDELEHALDLHRSLPVLARLDPDNPDRRWLLYALPYAT